MNQQEYKAELDRNRQAREQMKGYGNMSAAEKAMNRDDLVAFKQYESKNYSM
jgi:hypothetical protein